MVVFVIFLTVAPHFSSAESLTSVAIVAAQLGIGAAGVTLLMIAGEFDLSIGSVLALTSIIAAFLTSVAGVSVPVALCGALASAVLIGLLHGTLVLYASIPSFIVTLGGLMFWRAMVYLISGGYPVSAPADSAVLTWMSQRFANGLSMGLLWSLVVLLIAHWVLTNTKFGNWIYATGGNVAAARLKGVPINQLKLTLFVMTAVLACFSGLVQLGRFGTVDANRGSGLELEAIAAAVIGGSSLRGGVGSVLGTLLGCLTIAMIRQGLALINMPPAVYQALLGALLVSAVLINRAIEKRSRS
ncbi:MULTISPECIES: ABC transporter permease [unclassified Mesorhizobium]|uniref:ABC transporter permease n=1 Tax=unclassified Mesorhizobium TaxID=325217 RepID=UPI002414D336|nr:MULTISPECIES: ABC transporter permease [unclassified Mesorhizobium]MDG4889981.1 ABC transporter permease [Mesorhizobium sp. WSM4887]MDG4904123.1 ABC transporter permease [Mesorhizobium sp. WSM4962]MDG4909150.1 ABC transporter permease [Mesorhizobium sp. WSM4898]MDG4921774.1 ABC transporter permease [Mesorhizobium sp. WSM4989]